jgi:hypothetical protein
MSFAEATLTILQEAGEPLSYREILKRAVERGLIQADSKTSRLDGVEAIISAKYYSSLAPSPLRVTF